MFSAFNYSIWTWLLTAAVGAVVVVAAVLLLRRWAANYLKFRGARLVTCPETNDYAAVGVDAEHAAFTGAWGRADLRLRECSRWPEREGCGQECLRQIEAAPADCLVRTILTRWYGGKSCALCGRPLGEIQWLEHRPALRSPEGIDRKSVV